MPVAKKQPLHRDPDVLSKGFSRQGVIFCLRAIAFLLALAAIQIAGAENMPLMRILAGSPTPWAQRLDFVWADWGFSSLKPIHIAADVTVLLAALLFLIAAKGLHKAKRSALYLAYALTGILLVLNSIFLISRIWYAWSLLANESGSAFGKPQPQWADIPLALPALLLLLEIIALITLRLLTKLRIDLLH